MLQIQNTQGIRIIFAADLSLSQSQSVSNLMQPILHVKNKDSPLLSEFSAEDQENSFSLLVFRIYNYAERKGEKDKLGN